jgi:(1->4)-alpha-D-glucan 1-alpha-D-glucosylmutase
LQFSDAVSGARIPLSTYRLQFNSRFTFRDARAVTDYLAALGITDCYASSYLAAVPGSPHGYDVADPTRLNPDIGSDEDYWAWIDTLRSHDMGHVLDVVPNHMGIARSANAWWLDVLENGPSSRFAHFFDIEWHPVKAELADKVLIPILGDQYGAVLERQELQLVYREGAFEVRYYDEVLPVAPDTYRMVVAPKLERWLVDHAGDDADELQSILTAGENLPPRSARDPDARAARAREKEVVKRRLAALAERSAAVRELIDRSVERINGVAGHPRSFDPLDDLLNAQSYRLAHWRVASEEINYRRFFDVNQLAALRMEDPVVFDEVHRFIVELVRRGAATGLRIDHVDGLFSPGDYLRRLQSNLAQAEDAADPFYIVVEKILIGDERLPDDWPVHGTTGYEFAAVVNNLFVDRRNERALEDIYRRFVRERRDQVSFGELAYRSKKQILHETMSGDINSLAHQLNRFSERSRHFRDFTLYSLISTIKEIIACFPVYRSYVSADKPVSDHDRRYIVAAIECAKRRAPGVTVVVFDFIERLLLKRTAFATVQDCDERARFIGKLQQITGPVAAKGIEDTALYVYNRLLSLNEVGADPTVFGLEPSVVHAWMAERAERWPSALSATSTHDTKRGEDLRARVNILSEIPGAWKTAVSKWRTVNRRFKTDVKGMFAPDPNEEYFLYQTLVGAWPFEFSDADAETAFRVRVIGYMTKALREAKVHTSWLSPDETYEAAVARFVASVLDSRRAGPFLQSFLPFQARVAELGIYNSLAQLVIKITAPGVPDFYQGTELWDLNLVDPDNRRPVDYDKRRRTLAGLKTSAAPGEKAGSGVAPCLGPAAFAAQLLERRNDGRVKMFVTARALEARARMREVYAQGDYVPLHTTGAHRDGVFAFARVRAGVTRWRTDAGAVAITVVPRLIASLIPDAATPPIGRAVWSDTRIHLPALADGHDTGDVRVFRDAFTGATIAADAADDGLSIAAATAFEHFPVALLMPCTG